MRLQFVTRPPWIANALLQERAKRHRHIHDWFINCSYRSIRFPNPVGKCFIDIRCNGCGKVIDERAVRAMTHPGQLWDLMRPCTNANFDELAHSILDRRKS